MLPSGRGCSLASHAVDDQFMVLFRHDQVGSCIGMRQSASSERHQRIGIATFEQNSALLARGDALPFWLEGRQIGHSFVEIRNVGNWRLPNGLASESYIVQRYA